MRLLILAAVLGLTSFAGAKSHKPKVYIDHKCIQDVRPTEKTICIPLPDHPEVAKCNEILVAYSCITTQPKSQPQQTAEKGKDVHQHKEISSGPVAQETGSAAGGADPGK